MLNSNFLSNFEPQNYLIMKKVILFAVAALFMLSSCGDMKAKQEREKFVRDSIQNAERVSKEKMEKELFGDLYLGMSKDEILNSQFIKGSKVSVDNGLLFLLENRNGYDVSIDSLILKFNKVDIWYSPHLSSFHIQTEYTDNFGLLSKDFARAYDFLCRKYGAKYDEYQLKLWLQKSHFIRIENEYPCWEYKYGKKKIQLKLKGEDISHNYGYVIEMKESY